MVLILSVVASIEMPVNLALLNLLLCGAFTFVYFSGTVDWPRWPALAQWAWVTALSVVWLLMLPVNDVSIYLILSLFFVYLAVFNDWRGVAAVVAATLMSILIQIPDGLTFGGVVGPAISALVVVAIHVAYRKLWQVSRERSELIEELMATRNELAETQHAAGIVAERERIAHTRSTTPSPRACPASRCCCTPPSATWRPPGSTRRPRRRCACASTRRARAPRTTSPRRAR